jgi:hypothetical protein
LTRPGQERFAHCTLSLSSNPEILKVFLINGSQLMMENFPGSTFWKQMLQMRMKAEDTKLTFCRSKTISGATVEPAANALHVDQVPTP